MDNNQIWDDDATSCEITASGEVLVIRKSHPTPEHCWENDMDDDCEMKVSPA
ncbi:MAG TPA: hypothetical protein VKM55_26445 [Candidatus Lokiarchaeia archaeon]|nr:hypothetical protein [Candidatus Lokiarchaeia archaeon]